MTRLTRRTKGVTQQDVAERAGVTRATVSYVLSGAPIAKKISPEVIERVRAAAAALGYVPNNAARTLASGWTRTLGLVIGDAAAGIGPFWSRIAEGAEMEALAADYSVLLLGRAGLQTADEVLRVCHGRIDALLVLGDTLREFETALVQMPWPVVAIQPLGGRRIASVRLDEQPGIEAALRHLKSLGHRNVAWLGPPIAIARARAKLVCAAAQAQNLRCRVYLTKEEELPLTEPADKIIAHWKQQLGICVPNDTNATAYVCWNDRAALGWYQVLAERSLRVPEDCSVIGFDDCEAVFGVPPLSSISHEFNALGQAAVRLALQLLRSRSRGRLELHEIGVPARFVVRASTARPRCARSENKRTRKGVT